MPTRPLSILPVILALAACASAPPVPDMERLPGHTLGTPENSLEYFKAALLMTERQAAWHQYLCLSEALKRDVKEKQGQNLGIEAYTQIRDDVREYLRQKVGDLDDIEIGVARYVAASPHLAEVPLMSGSQRATVQMILETTYHVRWKDPRMPALLGTLPFEADPVTLSTHDLLVRVPASGLPPGARAEDVYRVTYERAWKILHLVGSDLSADIDEFLRKRDAERPRS